MFKEVSLFIRFMGWGHCMGGGRSKLRGQTFRETGETLWAEKRADIVLAVPVKLQYYCRNR